MAVKQINFSAYQIHADTVSGAQQWRALHNCLVASRSHWSGSYMARLSRRQGVCINTFVVFLGEKIFKNIKVNQKVYALYKIRPPSARRNKEEQLLFTIYWQTEGIQHL